MVQNTANSTVYTPDPWKIIETLHEWNPEHYYQGESIFALGNGMLGVRGSFEEGLKNAVHPNQASRYAPPGEKLPLPYFSSVDGTYLNGFYESKTIKYPEGGYGFAKNSQTMLNVPDGKIIRVWLGDEQEPLQVDTGKLIDYTRVLDMQSGLLERSFRWCSPNGREVQVEVERIVSFTHPNVMAIAFRLTPLFNGRVRIESILDGNVENVGAQSDPRVGSHLDGQVLTIIGKPVLHGEGGTLTHQTDHSHLVLGSAVINQLETASAHTNSPEPDGNQIAIVYEVQAQSGVSITLSKIMAYVYAPAIDGAADHVTTAAWAAASTAADVGYAVLADQQRAHMAHFWSEADASISGRGNDTALLQQGIRFNIFHLLQAAGRDGKTNIGSKGLSGEGYEGHYFWDTEMFAAPFFQYTSPEVCRSLLEYRYHILSFARDRAIELSHRQGAAFPWRTINGEECSAFFPAGTAQYHINADIAYAIKSYVAASGDTQFLIDKGAEIVFETARLWIDLGEYVPARDNHFCIHGVTGPDEYTALVDNNCYTNMMAQENLRYACEVAAWLKSASPDAYEEIAGRLSPSLSDDEIGAWKAAADAMYIPYDTQTGLFAQDDGFFNRAAWRWDWGKRDGKDVLLNRFHYLVIYRHQVCKQADVMLALYLLPERATLEQKRRNFNYYEQITTHDSSLSHCTFSMLASEIGYRGRAYEYFMKTARMDLDDEHGNVAYGVHIANMAGTWMGLVNGFAGLRLEPGEHPGHSIPHYHPYLPDPWDEYSFTVHHLDCVLQVSVQRDKPGSAKGKVTYSLKAAGAQPLRLKHNRISFRLDADNPSKTLPLL